MQTQWHYFFQQDGATCHSTPIVMSYLNRKARVLNGWPPNSPDLSRIEKLCEIMKERLNRLTTKPKNKAEFKMLIQQVYNSIEIETTNNLIDTFEYLLQMVKDSIRKTIVNFTRKGFHAIPEKYKVPENKYPPFISQDLYLKIYLENCKMLHRWKSIASKLSEYPKIVHIKVKNKAFEIKRKLMNIQKHDHLMNGIPFKLEKIIEYLIHENDEGLNENDEISEFFFFFIFLKMCIKFH